MKDATSIAGFFAARGDPPAGSPTSRLAAVLPPAFRQAVRPLATGLTDTVSCAEAIGEPRSGRARASACPVTGGALTGHYLVTPGAGGRIAPAPGLVGTGPE